VDDLGRATFRAELDDRDGELALRLAGELDASTVPVYERLLDTADGLDRDVVVEADELTFIDSSGLHALLTTQRRVEGSGHRVVLRRPSRRLRRLLELTDTVHLFELDDPEAR
jgi:anti-anti-sigma factor